MATIIKRSPDLLGGKYFCVGATNRFVVSSRDARKLVYVDSSNFGSILSTTPVAANPGAVCYTTNVVHCICEDGYLRKFTLSGDTLSAVAATVNAYTQVSTWIYTSGANFVCPWGWDGIQIMTHAGTAVLAQRATGLARVTNAYLNGSYLYCFDGLGKGVVLTISGSTITLGEQFAVPAGTNVDCIGLVNATTLGIGANTNPQYITLNITDPLVPVWASRTTKTAAIGAIVTDGPLISTETSPLNSDAGVYVVNGGIKVTVNIGLPSFYVTSVNGALVSNGNGTDETFMCPGSTVGGQEIGHWPLATNKTPVSGVESASLALSTTGTPYLGSIAGRNCWRISGPYSGGFLWTPSMPVVAKGFSATCQMWNGVNEYPYLELFSSTGTIFSLRQINHNDWTIFGGDMPTVNFTPPLVAYQQWHHLAVTYDSRGGGVVKVYIDGNLVATSSVIAVKCNTLNVGNALSAYVAGSNTLNQDLEVMIKDFRLYTREISAADVLNIRTTDNS